MLLGMYLTTLSMPTSGERTGAPWDVSNYPLYANVRGRGLVLLWMSLTTLSMPTSGERTGTPWDVFNYPLYANVRGEDWCSLGCI